MSRPRLHAQILELYEQKDADLLESLLTHPDLELFQQIHKLKIPLKDLAQAFTHTSFTHEFKSPHQEQLEFLGDAVLQLILTEELYTRYPQEKEGRLSRLRSSIVNEKTLSVIALDLHLPELIMVGKGEFKKNLFEQEAVLADTLEALLAQIYRHHGFEFTKDLFISWLLAAVPTAFDWDFLEDFDAKSKLQELSLAKFKKLPRYTSENVGEKFEIKLWINDELLASGTFSSKKLGEKELAQNIIKKGLL